MLTEEAHHMFVGDTGIARIVKRTLEVMRELGTDDPETVRKAGAIDLPTLQRYLNFWFSSSLDLFGSESSSNAASYFASGLKGRPDEGQYEDHIARDVTATLEVPDGKGGSTTETLPLRNAMNETVRGAYVRDCEIGVKRWNRLIQKAGVGRELTLPSTRFRRSIGAWAGVPVTPDGAIVSRAEWESGARHWLPSESDRGFVRSLMQQVVEPGKMAAWIAPPDRGINNLAVDYEYVHLQ
jgi:benzoyl-CoA 2,3-dioxygenase component B